MYNLYICIDFIYIMEWLVGNENQGTALKTIPTIQLWMSSERVIHHKHHQHHPPPSWLSETRSVKSPIPCVSPVYLTAPPPTPPPPPPHLTQAFYSTMQCNVHSYSASKCTKLHFRTVPVPEGIVPVYHTVHQQQCLTGASGDPAVFEQCGDLALC